MQIIATFAPGTPYQHSPGLSYESGSFTIEGSGLTSAEHVAQMDALSQLVWRDPETRGWFLQTFGHGPTAPAVPPDPGGSVGGTALGCLLVALFPPIVGVATLIVSAGMSAPGAAQVVVWFVGAIALGFIAMLVYQDRKQIGGQHANKEATNYAVMCFFLLIIGLPMYLYKRPRFKWRAQYGIEGRPDLM